MVSLPSISYCGSLGIALSPGLHSDILAAGTQCEMQFGTCTAIKKKKAQNQEPTTQNATNPHVLFYIYVYNCHSPTEMTSSFDGTEQRSSPRPQGSEQCRARPSVSSLKPYYFSPVCILLHNVLRCGLHLYAARLI